MTKEKCPHSTIKYETRYFPDGRTETIEIVEFHYYDMIERLIYKDGKYTGREIERPNPNDP